MWINKMLTRMWTKTSFVNLTSVVSLVYKFDKIIVILYSRFRTKLKPNSCLYSELDVGWLFRITNDHFNFINGWRQHFIFFTLFFFSKIISLRTVYLASFIKNVNVTCNSWKVTGGCSPNILINYNHDNWSFQPVKVNQWQVLRLLGQFLEPTKMKLIHKI